MRGLSIFIGGFPNEILLYSEIQAARKIAMPTEFYLYCFLYIVFATCAFTFQERNKLLKRFFKDGSDSDSDKSDKKKKKHDSSDNDEEKRLLE